MRQAEIASCALAVLAIATRASAEPARSFFMVVLPDIRRRPARPASSRSWRGGNMTREADPGWLVNN
jgi:hypothetical protein